MPITKRQRCIIRICVTITTILLPALIMQFGLQGELIKSKLE
jgi:hypothetical protein